MKARALGNSLFRSGRLINMQTLATSVVLEDLVYLANDKYSVMEKNQLLE